MSHQENIERILYTILNLSDGEVSSFCRGNPFDKLLRSYDEFNRNGVGLYRKDLGAKHYKMSVAAYESYESGLIMARGLYGEHRIHLKIIIKKLLDSDRSLDSVKEILRSNEVVLITTAEQKYLDSSIKNGWLGLRSCLPSSGQDRLEYAGITIAPQTEGNQL